MNNISFQGSISTLYKDYDESTRHKSAKVPLWEDAEVLKSIDDILTNPIEHEAGVKTLGPNSVEVKGIEIAKNDAGDVLMIKINKDAGSRQGKAVYSIPKEPKGKYESYFCEEAIERFKEARRKSFARIIEFINTVKIEKAGADGVKEIIKKNITSFDLTKPADVATDIRMSLKPFFNQSLIKAIE
ncbi:MAG: hypothetical protein AB7V50_04215, partial [Vampirovibrionia bacterium]